MHYLCKCGHTFPENLGKYGCPNCCGSSGGAKLAQKQAIKLKPCPGCKGTKTRIFKWDGETIYGECVSEDCHMSGPIGTTRDMAAEKWNALPR